MMQVTFDTQTAVNLLRDAGFDFNAAEAIVNVIKNAQTELATRQDLLHLEQRLIIKLGVIIFGSFGLFAGLLAYIIKV
jgi:hypothetical protein